MTCGVLAVTTTTAWAVGWQAARDRQIGKKNEIQGNILRSMDFFTTGDLSKNRLGRQFNCRPSEVFG